MSKYDPNNVKRRLEAINALHSFNNIVGPKLLDYYRDKPITVNADGNIFKKDRLALIKILSQTKEFYNKDEFKNIDWWFTTVGMPKPYINCETRIRYNISNSYGDYWDYYRSTIIIANDPPIDRHPGIIGYTLYEELQLYNTDNVSQQLKELSDAEESFRIAANKVRRLKRLLIGD